MKSLILFSLLFILVSSKTEKKKPLLSLAKTFLAYEDDEDYEIDPCEDETISDAKTCKAINKNLIPGTQCCFIKAELEGQEDEEMKNGGCVSNIKPFKPFVDIIQNNKFIPFVREIVGFAAYGPPGESGAEEMIGQKGTVDIDCPDSHLQNKPFQIDEFSQDEKDMLNSNNHCLNEIYNLYEQLNGGGDDEPLAKTRSIQALKCKDRSLLQSSKDAGLQCGTLNIKVNGKEVPEPLKSVNSCILFDYDLFSKIKIPELYLAQMKEALGNENSFRIEISDSKGRKYVFDSNRSSFISISKYLLILIGLILL